MPLTPGQKFGIAAAAIVGGVAGAWYFLLGGKDTVAAWMGGGEPDGGVKTYKVVVGSQPGDRITLEGSPSLAPEGIACFSAPAGKYSIEVADSTGKIYYTGTVQVTSDTKVNILVMPGEMPQVSVFAIPPGQFDPFKPFCGD